MVFAAQDGEHLIARPNVHEFGQFAPSKFASYLLVDGDLGEVRSVGLQPAAAEGKERTTSPLSIGGAALTGMTIDRYVEIDQGLSVFDGQRAWQHLVKQLCFQKVGLSEAEEPLREAFRRWLEQPEIARAVDPGSQAPVRLVPPAWAL